MVAGGERDHERETMFNCLFVLVSWKNESLKAPRRQFLSAGEGSSRTITQNCKYTYYVST